jgi:dipeptidyl aminopeptidase/acylaminoacyl peptidase
VKSLTRILAAMVVAATPIAAVAQDRVITPNENLVVDGIPALPASIADEVGPYTEFRSAALASWHPVRREVLVLTRFGDVPQVHLVKVPGGARRQLTFFPERVQGASYQPTTGDYFVFSKDVGGNEFNQIYRYDLDSAKVTLLTDGKSKNDVGPWSRAGDRIAYTSTRRDGADNDIYVVDPKNPSSDRKVADVQGGGWAPIDWSPDDTKLLVGEYVSANESYLWLVDVASGRKTAVTPREGGEQVAYGDARFGRDGRGLYLTTDKGSEFQRLAYYDLATKQYRFLTDHIKWDVESIALSDDGASLAFVTNEDGVGVLHLLATKSGRESAVAELPKGVISGLEWRKNGKEVGVTLSSARSTADVYSVSVDKRTVTRWTESETGGLDTAAFAEPELVRWQSFDGRSVSGFLYRPPAKFTGKRPVIVNIHGGPESQFRPSFIGRNNYFVNELGVAVVFPNVRGSSGYGKTYLALDNGMKREDSVRDIGALLDWIAQQPGLDASRVMVTGGSYGGYMTLAVATTYNDRIRASLDVVGISNFVSFLERTESYRRDLRRVEYGDEREPRMREFLLKIAPLNNAKKITKPLFVVQGKNDPRVPFTEAEQMVSTVKSNKTPVWYLLANDEGHGFAKKKNADYQFYATIQFARQYLLQ